MLQRTQQHVGGGWVGSSAMHLGDNDATFLRLLVAQHDDIRLTVKVQRFRCC